MLTSLACTDCYVSGLEQPSYETVLFSYGVGLGVLLASGNHEAEVKRLMELLDKTQSDLENVTKELARRKSPPRTNRSDAPTVNEIPHVIAPWLSEIGTIRNGLVWRI